MNTLSTPTPRLTSLSHGGGCGCKISPGVLADLLARSSLTSAYTQLLVGTETSDDAAVYQLNDDQAVIATTDFFMPIVDDPFDFGRIAATNAISEIEEHTSELQSQFHLVCRLLLEKKKCD